MKIRWMIIKLISLLPNPSPRSAYLGEAFNEADAAYLSASLQHCLNLRDHHFMLIYPTATQL
jgi:hypothetical protein